MKGSRIVLALTICGICGIGIAAFLFFQTMPAFSLSAAVTNSSVAEQKTSPSQSPDVVFSDEAVSSIASEKNRDDTSASSTITIEHIAEKTIITSELEVEQSNAHGNPVNRAVSYKYDTTTLINEIHSLSNNVRAQADVPTLIFDPALAQLANERSIDMATHDYLSHTTPDGCDLECRFKNSHYVALSWGENLAEYEPYTTMSASKLAAELVAKWSKSSEHRRNLISSTFTHHGVGVAMSGNRIVVTVIFSTPE